MPKMWWVVLMSDKVYDDPKKLAEARWHNGEKHSYSEMADYLDCSPGVISMRMNNLEYYDLGEFHEYGPEDFEAGFDATEVDEQTIQERIEQHIRDYQVEIEVDGSTIECPRFDLYLVVSDGDFESEVQQLKDSERSNIYLAMSEHRLPTFEDLPTGDGVGVVSVADDIELIQSPNGLHGADFLIRGDRPGVDYQNDMWLNHKREVDGLSDMELARMCSLRPQSLS